LNFKRFAFEKLGSNSGKSQRWRALMITASGILTTGGRLSRPPVLRFTTGGCLMWPASGASLYIYESRSQNFLSLSASQRETKRHHHAAKISHRTPPSSPTDGAPPTTPLSSRSAPLTSTSALSSSARAPPLLPVDCRRLPLGPRPFSCGPPPRRRPRVPRRLSTSSPSVAAPSSLPG
jgi:hypothetical protein